MPIVRPTPAQSKAMWKEVKRSDYCALQKRTIIGGWRIVTLLGSSEMVVAEAEDEAQINKDWTFIHDTAHTRFVERRRLDGQPPATDAEVTGMLISYLNVYALAEPLITPAAAPSPPAADRGGESGGEHDKPSEHAIMPEPVTPLALARSALGEKIALPPALLVPPKLAPPPPLEPPKPPTTLAPPPPASLAAPTSPRATRALSPASAGALSLAPPRVPVAPTSPRLGPRAIPALPEHKNPEAAAEEKPATGTGTPAKQQVPKIDLKIPEPKPAPPAPASPVKPAPEQKPEASPPTLPSKANAAKPPEPPKAPETPKEPTATPKGPTTTVPTAPTKPISPETKPAAAMASPVVVKLTPPAKATPPATPAPATAVAAATTAASPKVAPAAAEPAIMAKPQSIAPTPKATQEMMDIAKKWNSVRTDFVKAMEPVFKEQRAALERVHARYLEAVQKVCRDQKLEPDFFEHMQAEEKKNLAAAGVGLYSFGSAGCIRSLDEDIKEKNHAFLLHKQATLIQRVWRGYHFRRVWKKMAKDLYLRDRAAQELLSTEKAYVESLELMICEYLVPLRNKASEPRSFVTQETVATLFGNVEQIVPIHKDLLAQLEERMAKWDSRKTPLADIFFKFAPMLKLYTKYVSDFDRSSAALTTCLANSDFKKWHEAIVYKPEVKKLRLNAFLIMPVQRIPRYNLLLRELIAHTDKDHIDYEQLVKAHELIQGVATEINESKRRAEQQHRLVELQDQLKDQFPNLIQPHRSFIDEGVAVRDKGDGLQPCYLVLLSDMLLVTQRKKETIHLILDQLLLAMGSTAILPDNVAQKWKYGFQVQCGGKTANLYLEEKRVRDKWLEMTTKLTKTLQKSLSSLSLSREALKEVTDIAESGPRSSHDEPTSAAVIKAKDRESKKRLSLMPDNPKIKDVVATYREILRIQTEILTMPIDLRTLFPMYYQKLHPDIIARLKPRIDLLGVKLTVLDQLHQRAIETIKGESLFHMLDKAITDGTEAISGMKSWIAANYGKRAAQQQPPAQHFAPTASQFSGGSLVASSAPFSPQLAQSARSAQTQSQQDPQLLMRYILMWYINLSQAWELIQEADIAK